MQTACLENFCLQIMRAVTVNKNEIFYILDCWFGLLTFFSAVSAKANYSTMGHIT